MNERYKNDPEFRKRMIFYIGNYKKRFPFRTWANTVIQTHRQRGIHIEISRLELEGLASQTKFCVFCGCPLKYGPQNGKKKWHSDSASADRIDTTKPFDRKNIQIICVQCNSAKSKMTMETFKKWVEKVYINLLGKS
jgi:5-methylcytosine-specific restriction endonuclease McrA